MFINELKFLFRQPAVMIGCVVLLLFSFIFATGILVSDSNLNHQLTIKLNGLMMLVLPVVCLVITNALFLRDINFGMQSLVDVSPVSFKTRWVARFVAAVFCIFTLIIVADVVLLICFVEQVGWSSSFLTITLNHLILSLLPSVLVLVGISLFICLGFQKSKNNSSGTGFSYLLNASLILTVLFGIMWIGYILVSSLLGSPILAGSQVISTEFYNTMLWLDPYGITAAFDDLTAHSQLLTKLNIGNATFLINRVVILLVSLVASLWIISHFQHRPNRTTKTTHLNKATVELKQNKSLLFSASNSISVYFTLTATSLKTLLKAPTSLLLLGVWPVICFNEVMSGLDYIEPMSKVMPDSIDALNRVAFDVFPLVGSLLVALWSWQLCWREQVINFAEINASSALSNRQLVSSQITVITILVLILCVLMTLGVLAAELAANSIIIPTHYFKIVALKGFPLVLLGVIFVSIHHFVHSRGAAAFLLFSVIIIKFTPIMTAFGMTHTLWNIADSPLQEPDHFWGFTQSMSVYWPYMTFWILVALLLTETAILVTHRGTGLSQSGKTKRLLKGLSLNKIKHRAPVVAMTILVLATLSYGVNLHLSLEIEKPLTNSHKREKWKADYEKAFKEWASTPQPVVSLVESEVDIYPLEQRAQFKVIYHLENDSGKAIPAILISRYGLSATLSATAPATSPGEYLGMSSNRIASVETRLNQAIATLNKPLLVGEHMTLAFTFNFQNERLWPTGFHHFVSKKLSYLRSMPLFPAIGYQADFELKNEQLRQEHQLTSVRKLKPSELTSEVMKELKPKYDWANLKTTITTDNGQTALSQGVLVSQNHDDIAGRSRFIYETNEPIRRIPAWLSFPTTAQTTTSYFDIKQNKKIDINIISSTQKDNDAFDVNVKAIKDTLAWFSEHIAPYRGKQLSLIESPDIGSTGYALPQLMFISNSVGFRAEPDKQATFDQRYRRAVHETAHQWFGHDLGNGVSEDGAFLIESMAKYVELVMLEKHFGKVAMQGLVDYEQQRFEQQERTNILLPHAIINASQSHHQYSRATLVFAELRNVIGDDVIIGALKTLWQTHQYPNRPAVALDFVNYLKESSAQAHHELIDLLLLNKEES